jgi:formylglycine-generating enzyme required for sulfatase activity
MKPKTIGILRLRLSKLIRCLYVVCAVAWAFGLSAYGENPMRLGLRSSVGHATLVISGKVGTVYSIQSADSLSPANNWTEMTVFQAIGTNNAWTDTSAVMPRQRFYRVVPVSAPADTNLVFIQPGTFMMESPLDEALRDDDETQHSVTISRGFWIGKYLVTQKDYLIVMGSNPSFYSPYYGYPKDSTCPIESVTWFDANNYCAQRTQQERDAGLIPNNFAYRLPTESEWEYVARAGTTKAFYLGSRIYSGLANFDGQYSYDSIYGETSNPGGIFLWKTTPVGSYSPNPWGLYDVIGNVFEWCQDWYGPYPTGNVIDPQGSATGSVRIVRGGDWFRRPSIGRSAERTSFPADFKECGVGFRVVLASSQQ